MQRTLKKLPQFTMAPFKRTCVYVRLNRPLLPRRVRRIAIKNIRR